MSDFYSFLGAEELADVKTVGWSDLGFESAQAGLEPLFPIDWSTNSDNSCSWSTPPSPDYVASCSSEEFSSFDSCDQALMQPVPASESVPTASVEVRPAFDTIAKPFLVKAIGEDRFGCPVPGCSCTYRYASDLKTHVTRKHPAYAYLGNMIARPRSTKDGKEFKCPVLECSSGFCRERDLRRHVLKKHAGQPAPQAAYQPQPYPAFSVFFI